MVLKIENAEICGEGVWRGIEVVPLKVKR